MRAPPPTDRDEEDDQSTGNENKVGVLLLMALITFVSIASNVNRFIIPIMNYSTPHDNIRSIARTRKPLIATTTSNNDDALPLSSLGSNHTTSNNNRQQIISTKSLPIYLLQSSTNQTAQISWGTLSKQWNRTTQYTDLWELATPILTLPSSKITSDLPSQQQQRRPAIMIHCGPKTGSTTLRKACKINYQKTCGIPRNASSQSYPVGYMDETKLYPLIRQCANTSHFCAKEVIMPYEVPTFDDVTFIHMFPFRNYDEWAASALKQAYDRGGEKGCNKTKMLLDECQPSRMEIDFRKYGKTELSKFKEGVVRRMNDMEERHIFVLYHHRELDHVLEKLSDLYEIPLLPGSDGKGKEVRPKGTCDGKMLQMFHDCFSSELTELT
ncbi:hypothetical protein ACHAXR_004475 [Thalassiosira sp. AJA248-18]